jgi:ubiquinone/menaquinone biosynthesis C-methylase UbiE
MKVNVFNQFADEYDRWFDTHTFAYQSEVEAIRRFIPDEGSGIEIGIGTGRFSTPFEIKIGVEVSEGMAFIARSKGIDVKNSQAESLPFNNGQFDFALIITTLCFVEDPKLVIKEIGRILKPKGQIIVGIIDKESPLGKTYETMKNSNLPIRQAGKFYKDATFYSTKEVIELLKLNNFDNIQASQTIFSNPDAMTSLDLVKDGYGEGAFVVLSAFKKE